MAGPRCVAQGFTAQGFTDLVRRVTARSEVFTKEAVGLLCCLTVGSV